MATFDEVQKYLGYDIMSRLYPALGGKGNPFMVESETGGPGQYLDANVAQTLGLYDPGIFGGYGFDWQNTGYGNTGNLTATRDGQTVGSWSQTDRPDSANLLEGLALAGAAFGGLGMAGMGPFGGLGGASGGATGAFDSMGWAGSGINGATGVGGGMGAAGISALPAQAIPGVSTAGLAPIGQTAGAIGGGASLMNPSSWSALLTPQNVLGIGGNLLSGYLGDRAADKALDAQTAAGREANALQKYMYDTTRADFAPYREAGTSALGQIQALLSNPSAITQQPDYQFGLDQGTKALTNSASARGMQYSGAQGKALQKYGNDYAGSKLNESYNRLASIAGIGQQATGSTANAGTNYGNQAGNTLQNMGNAQGASTIAGANSWQNAFGSIINGLQEQSVYDQVFGRRKP